MVMIRYGIKKQSEISGNENEIKEESARRRNHGAARNSGVPHMSLIFKLMLGDFTESQNMYGMRMYSACAVQKSGRMVIVARMTRNS